MAANLIFMTGFDGLSTAELASLFSSTAACTINTNTAHTPFNTGRSVNNVGTLSYTLLAPTDKLIVGFYYKNLASGQFRGVLVQGRQGYSDQLCFTFQAGDTGKIEVRRGGSAGTLLATTAAAAFVNQTFGHLEIKFRCNASITSGDVVIAVDGVTILTLAGATNTLNTATALFDQIVMGNAVGNFYMDDFFVVDWSSGSTGLLGRQRIHTITPDGNGATSNFTGSDGNSTDNYLLVQDRPSVTSTYVESSVANDIDLYDLTTLAVTPATINGVQVMANMLKTDSGAKTVRPIIRSAGANYDMGADIAPGPGAFIYYTAIFATDPATAAAWTAGGVNSLQAGVKVIA